MRLVGHPRPAELRDYARASEEIEARLGELPGVLAVYRFGGVSAPGISDVDRLAVVDVDAPVPPVWATLTEATRALSLHPPFLVDPVTFAGHRLISQLEPLELASGSAIGLQERPEPGYVARLLGAESLLLNVVRLVKYRVTGRVKVRSVLCQLHTVRHGLELAGLDRARAPAAWALWDEVSALRCAWFALAPKRREGQLRQLVLAALPALLAALDSLAAELPGGESYAHRHVALGAPWTGLTLSASPGVPTPAPRVGPRPARALASVSSKAAEAAWRLVLRRRELTMPAKVLSLLSECPAEHAGVCARRRALLAGHRKFLHERGRGYASIALAPTLTRV